MAQQWKNYYFLPLLVYFCNKKTQNTLKMVPQMTYFPIKIYQKYTIFLLKYIKIHQKWSQKYTNNGPKNVPKMAPQKKKAPYLSEGYVFLGFA